MKKILILAYDFPPYVSVGGLRPYSWYKYFKEFDLYPIIVTRQWDNKYGNHLDYIAPGESDKTIVEKTEYGTIIRTPYKPNLSNRLLLKYGDKRFKLIRKIVTAYFEFMQFIFFIGTKSGLYYGAKEYLKNNKVDCLIATGEPFILFKYASKFNKMFKIPWIADYRDPWSQHKYRSNNFYNRKINIFFEKRIVSSAKYITTVSSFFKGQISKLFSKKKIVIIPNGYSEEVMMETNDILQNNKDLSIAFIGTIYPWHPWISFLKVLENLIIKNNRFVKLNFYGINIKDELVATLNNKFPILKKHVNIYPKLANDTVIKELAKNNLLLLYNDYEIMGTKIYDYLGLKRKILLCYSDDKEANILKNKYYCFDNSDIGSENLQEELIKQTNSGIITKDSDHLLEVLIELHKEFRAKGFIESRSINIDKYSRKNQTEKLAVLLNKLD